MNARAVIITCENFGSSHAANQAVYKALDSGFATGASVMVPCPWARDTAQQINRPIGVQLTLNAEYENYRWGPITYTPSLVDGDGGFPRTLYDLWEHADPEEVRRECRAQIERAQLWGMEISHLGNHLGVLVGRPEYFDIYLSLSREFNLPLSLAEQSNNAEHVFPARDLIEAAGILSPNKTLRLQASTKISEVLSKIQASSDGVVEILCSPIIDSPEARTIYPSLDEDLNILKNLEDLTQALAELKIPLVSWDSLKTAKTI